VSCTTRISVDKAATDGCESPVVATVARGWILLPPLFRPKARFIEVRANACISSAVELPSPSKCLQVFPIWLQESRYRVLTASLLGVDRPLTAGS
jgi:hypothetical protein